VATLIDHSVGIVTEAAFGLAIAPTRFHEWMPGNAVDTDPKVVEDTGIRQGSFMARTARRVGVVGIGQGTLQMAMLSKGMGVILQAWLGTGTATVVTGAVNQLLFTPTLPGSTTLKSLTLQEGVVRPDGTTDAITYAGATVKSGELSCATGGLAIFKADIDAMPAHVFRTVADGVTTSGSPAITSATLNFGYNDIGRPVTATGITVGTTIASVQSATAATLSANATATGSALAMTVGTIYATPSYPAASNLNIYNYGQLTGSIGGTLVAPTTTTLGSATTPTNLASIRSYSWKLDSAAAIDRWNGALQRRQPTVGGRNSTITVDLEYDSTTGALLREAQLNQTDVGPLILTHTGATLAAGHNETLQIVIPSVKVDSGAIPQPTDDKPILTNIQFKVMDNLTAAFPYWLVYKTLDTAL
jgi:hypothetical protein